MSFFLERYASRETMTGQNASAKVMYLMTGTEDERLVRATALANIPRRYESLYRQGIHSQHQGGGLWYIEVTYGPYANESDADPNDQQQDDQTGDGDSVAPEVKIACQGVTQHITQSLRTIQTVKKRAGIDDRQPPNYRQAIGVSRSGVAGTDIIVPSLTWTETWIWISAYFTHGYMKRLSNLIGRVNLRRFRSFDSQEVKFVDWSSDPHDTGRRKVSYTFNRSPNVVGFRLTEEESGGQKVWPLLNKAGHQYLWCDYEEKEVNSAVLMLPRVAYVEEVGRPGVWLKPDGTLAYEDAADGRVPTNMDDFKLIGVGK